MQKFIKQNKKTIGAFLFFILLTSISGFIYFTSEQNVIDNINVQSDVNNTNITDDVNNAVDNNTTDYTNTQNEIDDIGAINDLNIEKNQKISNNKTETSTEEKLEVYYLTVNDEEYNLSIPEHRELTVYELMQALSADSKKPFSFQTKEFISLGQFVESINGVENNPQKNQYWIYYVNGQPATIGISQYKIQPNDKIEWKFEKSTL